MALAAQMASPRRNSRRRAWVFFPMLIAFGVIIGVGVYSIVSPYTIHPAPPAPGTRGALVWGDGIFSNPAQVRAWLKLHGGDYYVWRKTHPAAVALVKPRPRHHHAIPARAKPAAKPATKVKAAAPAAVAVSSPTASTASDTGEFVRWFFTVFGLVLALSAVFTPHRLLTRLARGPVQSEREMRFAVAGAAIAVLGGVAVATLV